MPYDLFFSDHLVHDAIIRSFDLRALAHDLGALVPKKWNDDTSVSGPLVQITLLGFWPKWSDLRIWPMTPHDMESAKDKIFILTINLNKCFISLIFQLSLWTKEGSWTDAATRTHDLLSLFLMQLSGIRVFSGESTVTDGVMLLC